ncbi:3-oxoacyl-ACP synthase III family protein [Nitrospirillum amazonense]|uniref:3-oxoacyl-[acyl-carrier-protein] synthase-3 n=1 Tax=Nitrospirillum amazonense TaxID=28077 RepID=A0A560KI15_9PROT|nr:ketoacyl-ACP synthase III [Nitrospirillum amazonense]MDG3442960.1 ketoacyl-ACP synthase III [Nitrospirillum amazonense]TWB82898.1 3-oxoacyl-[acyl-carrier-protein] synthase-3 [Nitrospirillum amazonense]
MALARLNGVAVRGIVSALPARVEDTADLAARFGEEAARRLATATGIHARHLAAPGQCTSDLAVPAAQALLDGLGWAADSVDLLVFVSQTHDQVLPATACLVQRRLGLSKSAAAFDLSLGCSGYVYGLWAAGSALASLLPRADGRPARALLLAGDTTSHILDPDDRAVAPLFGDAAAATALEIDAAAPPMIVDVGTDGAGAPYLMAAGGAMRGPDRPPRLFMDGTQVFAFTLREVPGAIAATLAAIGWTAADVDRFVLHQANEMMLRRLGHKIGATDEQLVLALARHGNTSSASVPLALTDAVAADLKAGALRVLLSGFGVGWSWATAAATLGPLAVCETIVLPA